MIAAIYRLAKEIKAKMVELSNLILNLDSLSARLQQALDVAEAKIKAKDAAIAQMQARIDELSRGNDPQAQEKIDVMARSAASLGERCIQFLNRVG